MLELLLIGALIAIAALAIRRYHLRAQEHATLPVSFDRRVEPMDGTDRLLERRAAMGSNLKALVRPTGTAGRRSAAVVVELDGVPVGHLARSDAGRYRARNGDAVTTCRGQVVRSNALGTHELWVELHL